MKFIAFSAHVRKDGMLEINGTSIQYKKLEKQQQTQRKVEVGIKAKVKVFKYGDHKTQNEENQMLKQVNLQYSGSGKNK